MKTLRTVAKPLFFLALPWLCTGSLGAQATPIEQSAAQLATRIQAAGSTTVAVADFTDLQGRVTELGRYYAEEVSVALVNVNQGLKIIDRGHLRTLLKELKLQASGIIDEATAAELGRIAGVQVLITGTVTEQPESVRLTLKALGTKTADIQAATALTLPKSGATMALLRRDVVEDNQPADRSASAPSASSVRVFQNGQVVVAFGSASMKQQKSGTFAYVTLTLENKTAQDLHLGCAFYRNGHGITLMDSEGRQWKCDKLTGLRNLASGYENPGASAGPSNYTLIGPGVQQLVMLQFSLDERSEEPIHPGVANLAMEMFRYRETPQGKYEAFTVGLTGIPLQK
jgi:TolB-like protein